MNKSIRITYFEQHFNDELQDIEEKEEVTLQQALKRIEQFWIEENTDRVLIGFGNPKIFIQFDNIDNEHIHAYYLKPKNQKRITLFGDKEGLERAQKMVNDFWNDYEQDLQLKRKMESGFWRKLDKIKNFVAVFTVLGFIFVLAVNIFGKDFINLNFEDAFGIFLLAYLGLTLFMLGFIALVDGLKAVIFKRIENKVRITSGVKPLLIGVMILSFSLILFLGAIFIWYSLLS